MDLRLLSDASTESWGDIRAEGLWSTAQKALHINSLELLAVVLALKQFLPWDTLTVIAMVDNVTVVGQITNQGGVHSEGTVCLDEGSSPPV